MTRCTRARGNRVALFVNSNGGIIRALLWRAHSIVTSRCTPQAFATVCARGPIGLGAMITATGKVGTKIFPNLVVVIANTVGVGGAIVALGGTRITSHETMSLNGSRVGDYLVHVGQMHDFGNRQGLFK